MQKTIKLLLLLIILTLTAGCGSGGGGGSSSTSSQSYWAMTFGGPGNDGTYFSKTIMTGDGGYLIASDTASFGSGSSDMWLIKLSSDHSVEWEKTIGLFMFDNIESIAQTSDNGFIIAGVTTSTLPGGISNTWVLKLDSEGEITWQKSLGSAGSDTLTTVLQTIDGGFILAGESNSFSGDGNYDVWIVKLTSAGNISWQKTYGQTESEFASSIDQTEDEGYIVAGHRVTGGGTGSVVWILKLQFDGSISWQKIFGKTGNDYVNGIRQTSDGGFIAAAYTDHQGTNVNNIWIIKLTIDGLLSWEKTYGGLSDDTVSYVVQSSDGSYLVAGATDSFGAGKEDILISKISSSGNLIWTRTYGGPERDVPFHISNAGSEGFLISGQTSSYGAGDSDVWCLKIKSDGTISGNAPSNLGALASPFEIYSPTISSNSNVTPADSIISPVDTSAFVTSSSVSVQTQAMY